MKRVVIYAVVVLSTLVLLFLLWFFRTVIILFILSLFVAAAARPVISRLTDRGIPLTLSIILTYALSLGLVGIWLFIINQSFLNELQELVNEIAATYEIIQPVWAEEGTAFQQAIASRLPPPDELYEALAAEDGALLAQSLFTALSSVASVLGGIAIVLVLSIYWSIDRVRFERIWLSLVPASHRMRAREIWHAVEEGVGSYIRSEVIQGFMAVLLLGIGYIVMQIHYPTLLALVGALAWLIPIVGFIFAVIPAVLAGLAMSPLMAVVAGVYTTAVFLTLELFVEKRLLQQPRRQTYSSLFVVLLMIPLFDAYGLVGLLAASPLAVAIQIFLVKLLNPRRAEVGPELNAERIIELEKQLEEAQISARKEDGALSPELASLHERLTALLDKAEDALEEERRPAGPAPAPGSDAA
jgi:predicted PurR-regulated permease PerM